MKHLEKFNEGKTEITNIKDSDLYTDFFDSVLDVVENTKTTHSKVGFMWITNTLYYNNEKCKSQKFFNQVSSQNREEFINSVKSNERGYTPYARSGIRMCFYVEFVFQGHCDLSTFLTNIEKMQELQELQDRMGDVFDSIKVEIISHDISRRSLGKLVLYAICTAKQTIEIGNKVKQI